MINKLKKTSKIIFTIVAEMVPHIIKVVFLLKYSIFAGKQYSISPNTLILNGTKQYILSQKSLLVNSLIISGLTIIKHPVIKSNTIM